jgi:RNA processing factor Prp31
MSAQEIELIKAICDMLEPFYEFMVRMSGTIYTTISSLIPNVSRLMDILRVSKYH